MHTFLKFVAATLLGGPVLMHAQITPPDTLAPQAPSKPEVRQRPGAVSANLQWLWAFAKPAPIGRADDLRLDARFQQLLHDQFRQPQAMWGISGNQAAQNSPPLASVIQLFLTQYGEVTAEKERVLTVDGCVPSFCPAHGMLWLDLGATHPLMVFVAANWTAQGHAADEVNADYDLWLFPNRAIEPDDFPLALSESISHWDARLAAAHRGVPHIAHAYVIEPDGTPEGLDPQLAGANTLPPQPDTVTPKDGEK